MGATLANNGVNPVTGARAIDTSLAERVLSVMSTCGMYDAAGEWVAEVGMAAKSGVGGGKSGNGWLDWAADERVEELAVLACPDAAEVAAEVVAIEVPLG